MSWLNVISLLHLLEQLQQKRRKGERPHFWSDPIDVVLALHDEKTTFAERSENRPLRGLSRLQIGLGDGRRRNTSYSVLRKSTAYAVQAASYICFSLETAECFSDL